MNREILFRAWDKYDKKMYKIESINFNCFGEIETITIFENDSLLKCYNKNHNAEEHNINALILCQYTGLTDKNGTKIFEGDILRYREYLSDGTYIDSYDIVFYNMDYGTFEVKFNSNNDDTEVLGLYLSRINNEYADYEVIGNIYEKEGK